MDCWNPIMAETYIKRVPLWKAVAVFILSIPLLLVVMWAVTVFLFSLEKVAP